MSKKTSCYKCEFKGEVLGSAHISCKNPDPLMTGAPHGMKNGWFFYPINFDPVWREKECNNFKQKD